MNIAMGKVLSVIPRRVQRFNIENRAHKVISKDKPTPAPKHPGTTEYLENFAKEHPEIMEEGLRKDSVLDERLKQIYLVSHDLKKEEQSQPNRPLPLDRHTAESPEYGFIEPDVVPRGRVTLRSAIKFIQDHQADPKTWTVDKIADAHLLSKQSVENILQHFHTFEVYIPPTKGGKESLLAQSSKTRKLESPVDS
ncbi:hypothetical protein B566_EDAN004018 [Ephemera danica]|nr:hypothetical protein B566_EDAN004018 [Ephemera danica]